MLDIIVYKLSDDGILGGKCALDRRLILVHFISVQPFDCPGAGYRTECRPAIEMSIRRLRIRARRRRSRWAEEVVYAVLAGLQWMHGGRGGRGRQKTTEIEQDTKIMKHGEDQLLPNYAGKNRPSFPSTGKKAMRCLHLPFAPRSRQRKKKKKRQGSPTLFLDPGNAAGGMQSAPVALHRATARDEMWPRRRHPSSISSLNSGGAKPLPQVVASTYGRLE